MYCTFVLFVNQHFPGLPSSGTHCISGLFAARESGTYVPSDLIYPSKRKMEILVNGGPPQGTVCHCQDKTWMDYEVFWECKRHPIWVVRPMTEEKLLLILDGHTNHTLSLDSVDVPRKHEFVMLTVFPHTTHRMRCPDVESRRPFST
jgi:hypothetical protein